MTYVDKPDCTSVAISKRFGAGYSWIGVQLCELWQFNFFKTPFLYQWSEKIILCILGQLWVLKAFMCKNLYLGLKKKWKVLVPQSCPTLCDPMGSSPPGSPIYGILQAGILELVAIPFSKRIFLTQGPRDRTKVSHTAGRFFIAWAIIVIL